MGKYIKVEKFCNFCKKSYKIWPYRVKIARFCSRSCLGKRQSNIKALAGYVRVKGEKNPHWKGDKVKMSGLHMWVKQYKGKPTNCEGCGMANKLTSRGYSYIQLANRSGKYKRDLDDWIYLCQWCHRLYDSIRNRRKVAKKFLQDENIW